jgi:hypothetical protein
MSKIVGTSHFPAGEPVRVINQSPRAVRYRVEFPGTGSISFDVLPGASFEIFGSGEANINIEHLAPAGISAVPDISDSG